jgi:hypothetical protein
MVFLIWSAMAVLAMNVFSQDEEAAEEPKYGWSKEAVANLNFTQSSFDNWTQGGENTWAWLAGLSTRLINDQEKINWTNTGKFEYGQSKIGDDDSKKSADEIFIESVLSYKMKFHVNPYIAVNGRTQFASAYDYTVEPKDEISKFLNPGYFMESFGVEYKKEKIFRTRFGFAAKQTVVTDTVFAKRFTDKSDTGKKEKVRNEIGLEWVSGYNKKIYGNIVYATTLEVFSNVKSFEEIDVRWDNLFSAEIAKYLAVSFNFQIYYDRDISIKRQLKQILSVGLKYSLL